MPSLLLHAGTRGARSVAPKVLLGGLLTGLGVLLVAVLALVALFVAGALVSRFTDRSAVYSGGRQLVLGGAAAALTYAVGSLVGTGIG